MDITDYTYPFDLNGNKASNYIKEELHVTTAINGEDYNVLVPKLGPFHVNNLKLEHVDSGRVLKAFVDFSLMAPFKSLGDTFDRATFSIIAIHDKRLTGNWKLSYYCLGSDYSLDQDKILQDLVDYAYNPRSISYEDIAPDTIPKEFPLRPHTVSIEDDVYYTEDVIFALRQVAAAVTGDLKPFHQHELKDVNTLVEELDNRVNKYGNYKIGLCAPYFLENHYGTVALELPLGMVGLRVDVEVVFGSGTGKGIVSVGGVITESGNWTDTYAVSEGTCPAQTAACGLNSNGHPYIWIGNDDTNWVDTNALLSSVLLNADEPRQFTSGWKFGTVELPEERVTSFPIQAGGLAGVGLVPTSRKVNGYPLTKDVTLTATDVLAVPANKDGDIEEVITFANGSRAVIKARRTSPDGSDILLMMLLDDTIEYGSPDKQTILNGQNDVRPMVRTSDGLKRILIEGDDVGGGEGSASFVPETRKVNGYVLEKDITLHAKDVDALFFNDDNALEDNMILSQGHKYFLMVNNSPKAVMQVTTLETLSCTLLGAESTRTVLQGSDSAIPAVLIGSKLYPIKLDGYGASEGVKLALEEFITANTTADGNAVGIIGICTDTALKDIATVVGNNAIQTIIETKNELMIKNSMGTRTALTKNDKGVVVNHLGQGEHVTLMEEKQINVLRGETKIPLLTATKSGVELGSAEERVHLRSSERPTMTVEGQNVEIASLEDVNKNTGGDGKDQTSIIAKVPTVPLTTEGIASTPTVMVEQSDGLTPIWFLPTKATIAASVYTLQQFDSTGNVVPPAAESGISASSNPITLHSTTGIFTITIDISTMPEGVNLTKAVINLEDPSTGALVVIPGVVGAAANDLVVITANLKANLGMFNFSDLNAIVSPSIGIRVGEGSVGKQYLPLFAGSVRASDLGSDIRWSVGIDATTGELKIISTVAGDSTIINITPDGIIKAKDVEFNKTAALNTKLEAMEKRLALLEEGK